MQILRTFVGQHGQRVALTEPLQVGQVGRRLDRDLQRHGDSLRAVVVNLARVVSSACKKTYWSDWLTRLNLALIDSLLALICNPFPVSHVSKVKTTQIIFQPANCAKTINTNY